MSPDGRRVTYLDPDDLPYNSAWEISRDQVSLGKSPFRQQVQQPNKKKKPNCRSDAAENVLM